jgi:hypothetical protein
MPVPGAHDASDGAPISAEALAKIQQLRSADAEAVADDGTAYALPASLTG